MKLKLFIIIIFFTTTFFSQNTKIIDIDSLKKVAFTHKIDTTRVLAFKKIAGQFWFVNWDSSYYYAKKSHDLAYKINYNYGKVLSLIYIGVSEDLRGNFDIAYKSFYSALKLNEKVKDSVSYTNIYYNLGNLFFDRQKLDSSEVNYKRAIVYAKKFNQKKLEVRVKSNLAVLYQIKEDYKQSIETTLSILPYLIEIENWLNVINNYNGIGNIYYHLKDFDKAMYYYNKAKYYAEKHEIIDQKATVYGNIGNVYNEKSDFQNALKFYNLSKKFESKIDRRNQLSTLNLNIAELYLNFNKTSEANILIDSILGLDNLFPQIEMLANKLKGSVLQKRRKYNESNRYYKKALNFAIPNQLLTPSLEIVNGMRNNYALLQNESESEYLIQVFDSLTLVKNADDNKKAFYLLDTKYQTAEKEAKIKEQELQLEKEKSKRNQLYYSLGLLAILAFGGYLWTRNRQKRKNLESENALLDMKSSMAQMELQNLNQQLDPHEVKNMLQTLAPEIQVKAPEAYKNLIHLSQLTKAALNNKSITDSLENQLQQIESYLSIEKKIVTQPLSWEIDNKATHQEIQLPRLLLKNMVENAVKHGIKNLTTEGKINVAIHEIDSNINISVDDNGVGRKQSVSLDSGIGTSTYFKLFDTLNAKNKHKATMEIIDKEVGTKVEIKIPLDYKYD